MSRDVFLVTFVLLVSFANLSSSSIGDVNPDHRLCMATCEKTVCKGEYFTNDQGFLDRLVVWTCADQCKYSCMWRTVNVFHKFKKPTPQFHGKWPFIRWCGMQEPASVIFSLMNLAVHVQLLKRFMLEIPPGAPMRRVWLGYGLVSINAWIWSSVFHTRDVALTEMLDYFSAFAIVVFTLLAFTYRVFEAYKPAKAVPQWPLFLSTSFCFGLYFRHIYNMSVSIRFDYGFNMLLNVSVGIVNAICWLVWSRQHWQERPYVKKAAISVTLLALTVGLELMDFVPIFWTFDAHSLWHASTVGINYFWYSFITNDCKYLMITEGAEVRKRV